MAKRQRWNFGPPSVEKALGSLPVVAALCRRLGIAATIDELCPVRDVAIATHGEVIETLVANRLTSPTPLLGVEDWARAWAVPEVFGVVAEALNDDRLGRALDAIAPQLDAIVGTIGARAITAFGLDVSRLHWDMTSISLHGHYDEPDEEHVRPRYGKPKDRRPDLKPGPDRPGRDRRRRGAGAAPAPSTAAPARSTRSSGPWRRFGPWPASAGSCWWATPSSSPTPTCTPSPPPG